MSMVGNPRVRPSRHPQKAERKGCSCNLINNCLLSSVIRYKLWDTWHQDVQVPCGLITYLLWIVGQAPVPLLSLESSAYASLLAYSTNRYQDLSCARHCAWGWGDRSQQGRHSWSVLHLTPAFSVMKVRGLLWQHLANADRPYTGQVALSGPHKPSHCFTVHLYFFLPTTATYRYGRQFPLTSCLYN